MTTGLGAADVAVAANGSLVYVPSGAGGGEPADGRVGGSPGTCLTAAWHLRSTRTAAVRVSPRWGTARAGHRRRCLDLRFCPRNAEPADEPPGAGHATRSGRLTASASSLRRTERATRSCSGGRRMAPAATSGSSRVRKISSICSPTAGRQTADSSCSARCRRAFSARSGRSPIERPSDVNVLLKNDARNVFAAVSPDGRWMAYTSHRLRSNRDLCRAVSGARKPATDLYAARPYPTLVA